MRKFNPRNFWPRCLALFLVGSSFAGQLQYEHPWLYPVDFGDVTVQVFASNDLQRWRLSAETHSDEGILLSPTNRVEFFRARAKPAPARITFNSLTVTGSVFVLSGSADKVLIDLQCEKLKGRLTQQHFGLSNKLSILTAADFVFPPQMVSLGTNLFHCSFLDIDNNRILTNITVISLAGSNTVSSSWNTNGAGPFFAITAHSFSWSYTYFDEQGAHSKEASGSLIQPDGAVNESTAKSHFHNNYDCSATYSGVSPYLYLQNDTGPCDPLWWRIYPAALEFGTYSDTYPGDAYSHSCNSAVNLYLPGNGTRKLHVVVQFSVCRWLRDGTMADELNDCVTVIPPFYIGGVEADSAGRIMFDTTDGTQWDITPTLAPMNNGYFDYDVDYTVSEIPIS